MKHQVIFILCSALLLSACFNEDPAVAETSHYESTLTDSKLTESKVTESKPDSTLPNSSSVATTALAKVGNQVITKAQIDKRLELKLFDLEWAAYELRLSALSETIEKLTNQSKPTQAVQVLIEPPIPPRLALETNDNLPSYGKNSAPVTLTVFCSYPSSHCARMMPVYQGLTEIYKDQIKLEFVDFPQKFHFNAGNAAVAARCANEYGQFWRYHKGLLSRFDELKSDDVFVRMAQQVGIEKESFKSCLANKKHIDAVKESARFATSLGLSKVPTTLINGLYINGPRSIDTLRFYIDKELEQAKRNSGTQTLQAVSESEKGSIPLTQLPLELEHIQYSADSSPSMATINLLAKHESNTYTQDDEILPGVFLVMIREDNIIIENDGILEMLLVREDLLTADSKSNEQVTNALIDDTTQAQVDTLIDEPESVSQSAALTAEETNLSKSYLVEPKEIPEDLEYTYRGIVEPKGETPLSRNWVQDQLVYRSQLSEHFQPAELDVEGYQLMRLTETSESDFYQTLGLQDKDVIMRVNDQWVHSGQNNLFEKLESEEEVSIVLMRKGLPVHIHYAIN